MIKELKLFLIRRGGYRYLRRFLFFTLIRSVGIKHAWGCPSGKSKNNVHYYPYSATDIQFPDNYFDRVFCLSVIEHIPVDYWKRCVEEFERVLKPRGYIVVTLDMSNQDADRCQYVKLIEHCSLQLIGCPDYKVPIPLQDKQERHPGHPYETIGLVWRA